MKNSKFIQFILGSLFIILFAAGCTKNFDELNTNPKALSSEQVGADYNLVSAFLQEAQRFIIPQTTGYQTGVNLASQSYCGYVANEAPFVSNMNNMTYALQNGWINNIWNPRYTNVMNPTYKTIQLAADNPDFKDLDAFARIIRVSAMSRVSEHFGPIIFSQYNVLNEEGNIAYDDEPTLYANYFEDLDIAINTLKSLVSSPISPQMRKADLAYSSNNYENWLRYANTLRLRLALRVVYADPGMAKTHGEAALNPANGGLLEENSQNCYIQLSTTHPLNIIGYDWSDTRMNAQMESIMGGYNDPRISKYFVPADDPVVLGQYKGIRLGVEIDAKSRYDNFSKLVFFTENKHQLMVAAESWFLRAEAALRGWANAGDAQTNYETGIQRSFELYEVQSQLATYLADGTSKPKPYQDPKAVNPGQNDVPEGSPHLSTITIKWEDGDSNDRKLERIITQKWIAIFPDGEEAWAEYRRTGYPILFPIVVNHSAGKIPTIPGIRRMQYPVSEYDTNTGGVEAAVAMLGGPDTGAPRLWWDKEDKSFR